MRCACGAVVIAWMLIGCWSQADAILNIGYFTLALVLFCAEFCQLFQKFFVFAFEDVFAANHFSDGLTCGKEGALSLEHNVFAMFFPVLCDKLLCEILDKKFSL